MNADTVLLFDSSSCRSTRLRRRRRSWGSLLSRTRLRSGVISIDVGYYVDNVAEGIRGWVSREWREGLLFLVFSLTLFRNGCYVDGLKRRDTLKCFGDGENERAETPCLLLFLNVLRMDLRTALPASRW